MTTFRLTNFELIQLLKNIEFVYPISLRYSCLFLKMNITRKETGKFNVFWDSLYVWIRAHNPY